ncbi:MFS transporter [Flexivirga sp. ID2601S]|uniref:MFS transporter n=1 Tax=Flexivirga aerilata TaxID=1656889 RepID=A0A849AEL4_9MICO|nr:MFS transporter [Flexivirga aerilata]NNG38253.1 MFS transporter [Flexivirga aerilata]
MTIAQGTPTGHADPNRWRALAVCLVAGFMTLLDVSIVNVALPSIRAGLGAGPNALSWVVSGYALAFGLLLVPAGRIGDARGRRPTLIIGLAVFTLASAACGFAPNATLLVAGRVIQGLGGGLVSPTISGLIQSMFQGAERAKAFGLFGATVGISTAIGPLAGGVLIQVFGTENGWRSVFFVNLPIGALAILLALRWVPHHKRLRGEASRDDLDPVGVVLLGLAVLLVILPFIEQESWQSNLRLLLFPAAALMLGAFIWWERRHAAAGHVPVVDFRLFTRSSFSMGVALGTLYFAGFTGIFFIYAQTLQEGLGYSALESGLAATPFAVGSAVAAALGGRLVTRYGRPLVVVGLVGILVGTIALAIVAHQVHGSDLGWAGALPMLIGGLSSGLVISPNLTLTVSEVPVRQAGVAGGVLQTGQRIGSAAGIAITGSVFYGVLAAGGRPDFSTALVHGLISVAAFVGASLLVGLADIATAGRRRA